MKNKKVLLSLFLIVQIIALQILSFFPEFIENYYSNGLYPIVSKISRTLFGWIPFSFGDVTFNSIKELDSIQKHGKEKLNFVIELD